MIVERMINEAVAVFKEKMAFFCTKDADEALSAASAQKITLGIQEALKATGKAAYWPC